MDNGPKGMEIAFYTVVRKQASANEHGEPENCSVRLELAKVDSLGRLTPSNSADFLVPLKTCLRCTTLEESGFFVETSPETPLNAGQWWRVGDDRGPDLTWRCLGREVLNGISCLKLEGTQPSDDWNTPRADRSAWRPPGNIVWLFACSLRELPRASSKASTNAAEAAHIEPTQRCRVSQYTICQGGRPFSIPLNYSRTRRTRSSRRGAIRQDGHPSPAAKPRPNRIRGRSTY